jgi:carbamoyltransferase
MIIIGISCYYHESAAALLIDGRIVAAACEERFTRIKHDASFPVHAINYLLSANGIPRESLAFVVFYEKPFLKFQRNLMMSIAYFPGTCSFFVESNERMLQEKLWVKGKIAETLQVPFDRIVFVPHHLSHAAASFYSSPFEDAAFLTLDGVGEWSTGSWGTAHGNRIYPLSELRYPHSVGLLYSAVTAYLGFEVNDGEYKVMGMAGYGKPTALSKVEKLFHQHIDGSIELHLDYFAFHRGLKMYTHRLKKLFSDVDRFDLAASLQKATENIIFSMLTHVAAETHEKALAYGGGVALNSVVNGSITRNTPFRDVYVYPAAGDDGGAVGSALYLYHHVFGKKRRYQPTHMFLGQSYTQKDVKATLKTHGITYTVMNNKQRSRYVSDQLIKGKIIGWFEGKAEFGPRALGHRSILADPRRKKMKDIVNSRIKFREEFRPFAPMVLAKHAKAYFGKIHPNLAQFMLGTHRATALARKNAPAVVHVDGTSRIQTVSEGAVSGVVGVLKSFYRRTGVPVLLNTSFNLKGEPIVNSPVDALRTFQHSGLDILVLEHCIIEKDI